MTTEQIAALVAEIRTDYQIPPYLSDELMMRSVNECAAELTRLKSDADYVTDLMARSLIKNFVYYDLNHRKEEFEVNYQTLIKSWQLSAEVSE